MNKGSLRDQGRFVPTEAYQAAVNDIAEGFDALPVSPSKKEFLKAALRAVVRAENAARFKPLAAPASDTAEIKGEAHVE